MRNGRMGLLLAAVFLTSCGPGVTTVAVSGASALQSYYYQLGPGATGSAFIWSMAVDSNGNTFVVGGTSQLLPSATMTGSNGAQDLFVSKFDSTGAQVWTQQMGGGGTAFLTPGGIGLDSSGNIYVTGYTNSSLLPSATVTGTAGGTNVFISKLNSSGTLQWTQQIATGSSGYIDVQALAVDSSGNSYICGVLAAGTIPLPYTLTGVSGAQNFHVMKFNSAGKNQWAQLIGVSATSVVVNPYVECTSIAVGTGGNIFVNGFTMANTLPLGTLYGTHSYWDLFIGQFNSAGVLQWTKQVGGNAGSIYSAYSGGATSYNSIALDSSGSIYVASNPMGTATLPSVTMNGSHGTLDLAISKFDSSGNYLWTQQYGAGGSSHMAVTGLAMDSSGNLFVTGWTDSTLIPSASFIGVHGSNDYFIAKYNSFGKILSAQQFGAGGGTNSQTTGAFLDTYGNLYVIGSTSGYLPFATLVGTQSTSGGNYFMRRIISP